MTCILVHMWLSFILEKHAENYSFSYHDNTQVSIWPAYHTQNPLSILSFFCFFPLFEGEVILNFSHFKSYFSCYSEMSSPAFYLYLTARRTWNYQTKTLSALSFSLSPLLPDFLLGSGISLLGQCLLPSTWQFISIYNNPGKPDCIFFKEAVLLINFPD